MTMRTRGDEESSSKETISSGQEDGGNEVGSHRGRSPEMTKTQIIRDMAERLDVAPKQISAFFDLLLETATVQKRKTGEFTVPGFGKLVKAQRSVQHAWAATRLRASQSGLPPRRR